MRDPEQEGVLQKQEELHNPINEWFSKFFKVPPLEVNYGLEFSEHPDILTKKLQWNLFEWDDYTLAAMDTLVTSLKSVVIAMALWQKHITIDEAMKASNLEEEFRLNDENYMERYHGINDTLTKQNVSAAIMYLDLIPKVSIKH
jgi:ATP synthase mitochondrial F1 complex assembly factor 2